MEIDIHQTPIPDWGLECPRCRYALVGLPEHRCPECGLELVMSELVQPWTRLRPPRVTSADSPLPDVMLNCPRCSQSLTGAVHGKCPSCLAVVDVASMIPRQAWVAIQSDDLAPLTASHAEHVFAEAYIPFVPQQSAIGQLGSLLTGGPRAVLWVPREFWLEARSVIRAALLSVHEVRQSGAADQACAACGESAPAHFELCWNCGASLKS